MGTKTHGSGESFIEKWNSLQLVKSKLSITEPNVIFAGRYLLAFLNGLGASITIGLAGRVIQPIICQ